MVLQMGSEKLTDWCVVAQLPVEAQRTLVGATRVRRCERRETVTRQGDPVPGLAWLARGLLWLWTLDAEGRESDVDTAWSDSISIASLAGDGSETPWNATALVPSTVFLIPWDAVTEVGDRYPLDRAVVACVATEYRRRVTWDSLLRSVRLRPRLMMILRRMSDEFGRRTGDGVSIDFPVTQGDLARLAGVTRDEVGRVMREFAAEGLVTPIGRRGLLIPKPDRLGMPVHAVAGQRQ
jgi:CRP-like cAMP-binding protein